MSRLSLSSVITAPTPAAAIIPPDLVLPDPPSPDLDVEIDPNLDLVEVSKAHRAGAHEAIAQLHTAGASGMQVADYYTRQLDNLIVFLFDAAARLYARRNPRLRQRCGIFAHGSYGRRELSLYSDVDIFFLYHWKITPYAETVWETIHHSLNDARFEVGFAVRNVRECVLLAKRDLTVKSTLLDSRHLSGDAQLHREFETALEHDIIGKQAEQFFQEKVKESRERHQQHGNSLYLLEPEVKEGKGGLRDLNTAGWLARVKFKVRHLRELIPIGVTSADTVSEIESARDFLLRLRNGLHLAARAEQDQLTFEQQDQLAAAMGFATANDLMRQYHGYATAIDAFTQHLFERCLHTPRFYSFIGLSRGRPIGNGLRILDKSLVVTKAEMLTSEPLHIVTVFHEAQRHNVRLASETRQVIRNAGARAPAEAAATPALRDAFFAILRWKERVAPTLREMHALGVLEWLLPEFGHLRWRMQRDLYHTYTVDEHTLYGVAELERLRAGEYKTELPLLTQIIHEVDKIELLFLAMLFHDVGKGYGHEHSERGARMVHNAAARWQLSADDTQEWHTLVLHHLRMSYVAQRRDLADDSVIAEFAGTVGTRAVLKKLYPLTFSDMKAVGPKVWNPWKRELLDELYLRTLGRFETDDAAEEGWEARLERSRERLGHTLATVASPAQVATFLSRMPERYFLSTPEESIPGHLQLLSRFTQNESDDAADPYRATLVHFPEREFSELTVATKDRPGLFAMLTGVLAACRLDIGRARITTTKDGVALDVFQLSHREGRALVMDTDTRTHLYTRMAAVLRGERTLIDLLDAARPSLLLRKTNPRISTQVIVDNNDSADFTLVDVTAPDRVGLLFTIAYTLYQLGIIIHLAKINTNVDHVLDVFYVTGADGAKVSDPDGLAHALRQQLVERERS